MINNFGDIRSRLLFRDHEFYFLQIIKRRKDNPDLSKSEKIIKNFYIYSLLEFDNLQPKIISLCNEYNARAYFRLNRRNSKNIALQMLKRITSLIIDKNYRPIENIYPSVCGEYHSDNKKTWIIDIDGSYDENWNNFIKVRDEFNKTHKHSRIEYSGTIPTKNGFHIITYPFDISYFYDCWDKLIRHNQTTTNLQSISNSIPDIHKDSPTLLYMS